MVIKCSKCGYSEKTNKDWWVKVIGGAAPIGGFYAWVTYLLAGTGMALPLAVAIILGGTGMLVFKDQIIKWILRRKYSCPECNAVAWE